MALFFTTNSLAQKTDTLIHINGNVMTGEIKRLVDGILFFKMTGMGTINVEAEKISSISSIKLLQIRTKQGDLIFGQVDTCITPLYVKVGYGVNKKRVRVLDIIEIYPIKAKFWKRLSGSFDFGIDYAKSTNMMRANSSGRISYRKKKSDLSTEWSTFASSQKIDTNIITNQKADASITYKHLIKGRWLWSVTAGENSNSELGLDVRLYFGVNIQNDIIYTNRHHLYAQFGISQNREYTTDGNENNSPEGLLALSYNVFKHTRPEITLITNAKLYPNLKFNGRWRIDTNLELKYEVFRNFFIGFKVYTNYDSKPNVSYAAKTDWGTTFSIGYTFN